MMKNMLFLALLSTVSVTFASDNETVSWSDITSEDMGYTVSFPDDWFPSISFTNPEGTPGVIMERASFVNGTGAEFMIDVWSNEGELKLTDWLNLWAGQLGIEMEKASMALVAQAGLESLSFSADSGSHSSDMRFSFLQWGTQIFRLSYFMGDRGAALETFQAFVSSLSFSTTAERSLKLQDKQPAAPQNVYSCGGYSDTCYCGASNPFPCCSNNSNCTWWAWHKGCCAWGVNVPARRNAKYWRGELLSAGYTLSYTPKVNTIAIRVSGTYGHVAWVTSVGSGTVTVTEQNCDISSGTRTKTYSTSFFDGGFAKP